LQRPIDRFAARVGNVRVVRAEDHQKFTSDFFCASQGSGIGVLAELAVVDACGVVTDRCADVGLEGSTEGEVAADAETHDADLLRRDFRVFGKPVETRAAIGIEMRDGSHRGVLLAARATGVIKGDHRSGRFDAAINFRGGGNKSVSGKANACAQHGRRELENVGITPDAGVLTFDLGRGDEGSHRGTRERNVRVFGMDDHLVVRGKF
jgi:hypothetical protein